MLADALAGRSTQIVALAGIAWVTWTVWSYVTSPLRKYPGPFLAGEFFHFVFVMKMCFRIIRLAFLGSEGGPQLIAATRRLGAESGLLRPLGKTHGLRLLVLFVLSVPCVTFY